MSAPPFDRHLLPPMGALRAFEAAARLESFTLAASELNVTQGAVSRQIRLLEEMLEIELFERGHQRVTLTEAGRFYAQRVSESLDYLMSATARTLALTQPGSQLHVGIVPTFGSRWIIPRLRTFIDKHPRLQLRLSAIDGDPKFALEAYDAALVVGRGDWPNAIFHRLESEELVAVAAPRWLRAHKVKTPADLIGPPLLIHTARPNLWSRWFALNGVDAGALVSSTLSLEQINMTIDAAVAELGAAILPRALILRELQARDLSVVRGQSLYVNEGFHFVYARHRKSHAPLVAFRDWLLGQK
jgi:LysR family glycine cleavage system transcriptional activator